MTRALITIGVSDSAETEPGLYEDNVTQFPAKATVLRASNALSGAPSLVKKVTSGHRMSVVADPAVYETYLKAVYILWGGTKWTVKSAVYQRPRVIFSLGDVYNG